MNRCLWCNGSDGVLRTITLGEGRVRRDVTVHPEHEADLVAWHARLVRDTPRFVTIFAFTPLLLLAAIGLAALVSRSAVLVVLGLWLIGFAAFVWSHPYATPLTIRLVGVRRSVALARGLTAVLATGGVIALLVAALVSLAGAVLGGLAGMRFHRKVDRTGLGR